MDRGQSLLLIIVSCIGWIIVQAVQPVRAQPAAAPDASIRQMYVALCSSCHGSHGDGNGPAAPGLMPRPLDFTNARYMRRLTDAYLAEVIRLGKVALLRQTDTSGTSSNSMPGFGDVLSSQEIAALADVALAGQSGKRRGMMGGAMMGRGGMRSMHAFGNFCASCHGPQGHGDGAIALSMQPPPSDFSDRRLMSRFSRRYLVELITYGKLATIVQRGYATMPAIGAQLDDATLQRLVAYIRTFARPRL